MNMRSLPSEFLIRAIATVLVLTAAFGATVRFPLPSGARELTLAAYALLACAMLVIGTSPHAVNVGMAVLMLLSGIELAYAPRGTERHRQRAAGADDDAGRRRGRVSDARRWRRACRPSEESTSMELMPVSDPSTNHRNMPADREDRF